MPFASGSSNLEQLKHQAKDLLRAYRTAHPEACARIATHLPGLVTRPSASLHTPTVRLAHALLVIARENGFPSWPRLKAAVLAGVAGGDRLAGEPSPNQLTGGCSATYGVEPPAPPLLGAHRAGAIAALGRELVDLATRQDVAGLAMRFSWWRVASSRCSWTCYSLG